MKIEYDKPIEITKEQYNFLYFKSYFSSLLAFRQEGDKYFIKLWSMKYKDYLDKILNKEK